MRLSKTSLIAPTDVFSGRSPQFISLLLNCSRYLYEASDYDLCLKVTEAGALACNDKESLQYADLCGAAGSAYYELNRLGPCRSNWETYKRLQDKLLPNNHLEVSYLNRSLETAYANQIQRSASYHNMGNLEYAAENQTKAMKYLNYAIDIRVKAGDPATNLLATSYLCVSRVYYAKQEYEVAFKMLGRAEALFARTIGSQAHLMA